MNYKWREGGELKAGLIFAGGVSSRIILNYLVLRDVHPYVFLPYPMQLPSAYSVVFSLEFHFHD